MSTITYDFLENNLRTTSDTLRNIDVMRWMIEHKKSEISLIYRLGKIIRLTYSSIALSFSGSSENKVTMTEDEMKAGYDNIQRMVKDIRGGLEELSCLVSKVSTFSNGNLIQRLFFYFHVSRPMKKISETFEDIELLVHALDVDDQEKVVDSEEMLDILNV